MDGENGLGAVGCSESSITWGAGMTQMKLVDVIGAEAASWARFAQKPKQAVIGGSWFLWSGAGGYREWSLVGKDGRFFGRVAV